MDDRFPVFYPAFVEIKEELYVLVVDLFRRSDDPEKLSGKACKFVGRAAFLAVGKKLFSKGVVPQDRFVQIRAGQVGPGLRRLLLAHGVV